MIFTMRGSLIGNLICLFLLNAIFISCGMNGGEIRSDNAPINIVGSWEGFDTLTRALGGDSKIVLQFQSDSLFQEFGFYEGEWKTRGVWDLYESNGTYYIKLIYEKIKSKEFKAEILYYSTDSMIIDLSDDFHSVVYSLTRSRSMDGGIVYDNPIFKLEPHNVEEEEEAFSPLSIEQNRNPNVVVVTTPQDNYNERTIYVPVRPSACSYCKPYDEKGWSIRDYDNIKRIYTNFRYVLRPGYKPCSTCQGTGNCKVTNMCSYSQERDGNYICYFCKGERFVLCENCKGSGFSD